MVPDRLRLPVRFDAAGLRADACGLEPTDWAPHFNRAVYEGEWSGAPLRSVGGRVGQLYPDPTAIDDFAATPLLARCSAVAEALRWFDCPLLSVRFLRLGAGARIHEHTDFNLGYDDGEVRIHVPVVTSDEVTFVLDDEVVPMAEGEAWYLDHNRPHAVVNRGIEPRIHLVIDCVVNDWLSDVLRYVTANDEDLASRA